MKGTEGWNNGPLLLRKQLQRHSVCSHDRQGDALSQGVMEIAPFITGGQQISWTLAPRFSPNPCDRCHRGWGEILAGGCVLELLRVWGWKAEWKVVGRQVALGPEKAQTGWGQWAQSWAEKAPFVLKARTRELCLSATTFQGLSLTFWFCYDRDSRICSASPRLPTRWWLWHSAFRLKSRFYLINLFSRFTSTVQEVLLQDVNWKQHKTWLLNLNPPRVI